MLLLPKPVGSGFVKYCLLFVISYFGKVVSSDISLVILVLVLSSGILGLCLGSWFYVLDSNLALGILTLCAGY